MTVRALFRGPSHVLTAADAEFRRLGEKAAGGAIMDRPAAESWTRPVDTEIRALMDATYHDGMARQTDVPSEDGIPGSVLIVSVSVRGRRYGVAIEWLPGQSPTPATPVPRRDRSFAQSGR